MRDDPPRPPGPQGRTYALVAEPRARRPTTREKSAPPWMRGVLALLVMAGVVLFLVWALP
jgi:hypothetical protein